MTSLESTRNIPATEEAAAGAAAYSKLLLAFYDIQVMRFEIPFVFKCPLKKLTDLFDENLTDRHLDVGVGTGFFLDKCRFPVNNPTVHLMDLNRNSLEKTAARIRRYSPVAHQWNVLEPVQEALPVFKSISACNFLHCLPGTMADKGVFFENMLPYLEDGGVFFGASGPKIPEIAVIMTRRTRCKF
ncbi:MAG: class I SAM-dependent methyltransferase [Desulfobacterales bacterium]|nr:class I SAM-dependent methyltransferase [Desulfobacterales bacterium]